MLRKKVAERLTVRIFLITLLLLLCAGAITFGLIAWATPSTYTTVVNNDLTRQVDALATQLSNTPLSGAAPLLDDFIRTSGAQATLVGPDGELVDTGSQLSIRTVYEDSSTVVTASDSITAADGSAAALWDTGAYEQEAVTVTLSEQASITTEVRFSDQEGLYALYVTPRVEAENLAVRALVQMAPWLLLVLLAFSLLCALVYSRYITRPIVRLSRIAGKMAVLDFHWICGEVRRDEIGTLGRSLDQMAHRLSAALADLEEANRTLRGEVEQERELDRQRMAFFSAASHELKTPVTILKGQLSGMLEGVDVYRDRDKYLLRSLQVTGRMEHLIGEMLAISRMETGALPLQQEPVDLSVLLEGQLSLDQELFQQRRQPLSCALTPGISITGDPSLLGKAVGNLLSNASLYSPKGASVRVWCGRRDGRPAFTVENTRTRIGTQALPHLFEAFYREETSRSRSTGGSGLGLYLVKMIFDRHGASCTIENTEDGVRTTVLFPKAAPCA